MRNISDWKIWRLFQDDPNDWTLWDRFVLWFDFWWNEWCCVIMLAAYYLLLWLGVYTLYQLF